jgi:preprotein translocase subunit SecB
MSEGSITADFDFISYKIDSISMKMGNDISFLKNTENIKPDCIQLSIRLRDPEKFVLSGETTYIGGLMTQIRITDGVNGPTMLEGKFGISGMFTSKKLVDNKSEETFAKVNLPALLMPYLRAAMSNILSNAGFGTMLFPLVNIYELAKTQNLSIIDNSEKSSAPQLEE